MLPWQPMTSAATKNLSRRECEPASGGVVCAGTVKCVGCADAEDARACRCTLLGQRVGSLYDEREGVPVRGWADWHDRREGRRASLPVGSRGGIVCVDSHVAMFTSREDVAHIVLILPTVAADKFLSQRPFDGRAHARFPASGVPAATPVCEALLRCKHSIR